MVNLGRDPKLYVSLHFAWVLAKIVTVDPRGAPRKAQVSRSFGDQGIGTVQPISEVLHLRTCFDQARAKNRAK